MKHFPTENNIRSAITQIFTTSVEKMQKNLLGSLVPHFFGQVPMVCYVPEYEMEELTQFVNQFQSYLKNDVTSQEKCRLMILIYCHIVEAEFPSTVIWNLLRGINQEVPSWVFYGKNEGDSCELPGKRYSEIKKLSDKVGMEIGNVLNMLWHNKLRNAFFHAQYIIHRNGDFMGVKNISPITSNAIKASDTATATNGNPYSYTFSEISGLYEGSLRFLRHFIESYKFVAEPYKTGNFFDIPTGRIRWDNTTGLWVTR